MIKRLIFDIDDTLIKWDDLYLGALKDTILEYNLNVDYLKLDDLIEKYEEYYNIYTKENMLELFNKELNLNLDITFINKWLDRLVELTIIDLSVIDTLKYLSKKYEIVVLTNFFKDVQENRLKKAKLLDFIDKVYGGELYIKPSKESFKMALDGLLTDEAIMIGDNINVDIKGAINIGIKAILVDYENKYKDSSQYIRINNINQLKEML